MTISEIGDSSPMQACARRRRSGNRRWLKSYVGPQGGDLRPAGRLHRPCSTAHVPSFIRTKDDFDAKGIDEIICVAVNDPFVLKAWGEDTGADAAGITMLGDAERADEDAGHGLHGAADRALRAVEPLCRGADDGVVTHANIDQPNVCDISRGEQLLETL
jgi:peroxiredoxin